MEENASPRAPFEALSFTLLEGRLPRRMLRLQLGEDGMYQLHVEKGASDRPLSQFTRALPIERVQQLADALQRLGVFGWEESYGNAEGAPLLRWTFSCVFKADVFAVSSKGGSAVPAGFDGLLEELYRLDFPRGEAKTTSSALGQMGNVGAGMPGVDFSQLADLFSGEGLDGVDLGEMRALMAEAQSNPALLQQHMRREFASMSPDQQQALLDALAASGLASRAWWERWLRGF